jgi:hypothetical protein
MRKNKANFLPGNCIPKQEKIFCNFKKEVMEKIEFETFRKVGAYEIGGLTKKEPSCFNSQLRIEKYKVTIEKIEEPIEVLQNRLQEIWGNCDNHHHWDVITEKAKELNYTLVGHAGNSNIKHFKN